MMLVLEVEKLEILELINLMCIIVRVRLLILLPHLTSQVSIAPVVLLQMTDSVLILEGLAIEKMNEMLSLIFGRRC